MSWGQTESPCRSVLSNPVVRPALFLLIAAEVSGKATTPLKLLFLFFNGSTRQSVAGSSRETIAYAVFGRSLIYSWKSSSLCFLPQSYFLFSCRCMVELPLSQRHAASYVALQCVMCCKAGGLKDVRKESRKHH